ncbi:hypothetical protein GCM10010468_20280 [Actinocorallia longicatena]|uniref:Uncharacterized protein n=1 Tax=Actinocorallia longicatena TaxID=111803 RepID=A0ABP6Q650_9ACTN
MSLECARAEITSFGSRRRAGQPALARSALVSTKTCSSLEFIVVEPTGGACDGLGVGRVEDGFGVGFGRVLVFTGFGVGTGLAGVFFFTAFVFVGVALGLFASSAGPVVGSSVGSATSSGWLDTGETSASGGSATGFSDGPHPASTTTTAPNANDLERTLMFTRTALTSGQVDRHSQDPAPTGGLPKYRQKSSDARSPTAGTRRVEERRRISASIAASSRKRRRSGLRS